VTLDDQLAERTWLVVRKGKKHLRLVHVV